jgi:two-component system, OmpR family, sensor histidine kinase MprB
VSFRARLTLFSAAGIALVLVVGSLATYFIVAGQLRGEIDDRLRRQSAIVRVAAGDEAILQAREERLRDARPEGPGVGVLSLLTPNSGFGNAPFFFLIIDSEGQALAPGGNEQALPISQRAIQVAKSGTGAYYANVVVRGTDLRMYVSPAGDGYALIAARSLTEVNNALNRLGWSLAVTCLVGILGAALVGALVARGALRPVQRLTTTAERVTETHDLGERIETEGKDELSRLGSAFNDMLDSLEGAIRSQRQLVSDASHELRTPLTSLRTNVDLLRQGVQLDERDREHLLRDIGGEIDDLTTLVTNLVDLARGSQRDLHLHEVRLDDAADVVLGRARARFPGLEFTLEAEESAVWGDPEEIERAIWNLVENAAKWSNGGGHVELEVAEGEVVVRDHGPGVPAADRPFIFDRFYRSETARGRPGSGLGLAIVRQIAERHGGSVDVEDAEDGGARFRLALVSS